MQFLESIKSPTFFFHICQSDISLLLAIIRRRKQNKRHVNHCIRQVSIRCNRQYLRNKAPLFQQCSECPFLSKLQACNYNVAIKLPCITVEMKVKFRNQSLGDAFPFYYYHPHSLGGAVYQLTTIDVESVPNKAQAMRV